MSAPALAVGGVLFILITCVALAVHPFVGLVTVTVYVPPTLNPIGFCNDDAYAPGPDHA
jgi:hypothetical protein